MNTEMCEHSLSLLKVVTHPTHYHTPDATACFYNTVYANFYFVSCEQFGVGIFNKTVALFLLLYNWSLPLFPFHAPFAIMH